MDKLKQDEICGWCDKTDELVLMQQGGHVHTICRKCGSNGPLVTKNELGKVHKSQLRQIAALESENAALKKQCAELREERDAIYSDMNRIVPEQDRRIAELESGGWISVEDRLPNEYQYVLLNTVDDSLVRYYDEWWHIESGRTWFKPPTHWQPLPAPPNLESQTQAKMSDKGNCGSRISDKT